MELSYVHSLRSDTALLKLAVLLIGLMFYTSADLMGQCTISTPTISSGTSPICTNSSVITVSTTLGAGYPSGTTLSWGQSGTGSVNIGTGLTVTTTVGETVSTTLTGLSAGTVNLTATVLANGGCGGMTTSALVITVETNVTSVTAGISSGSATLCEGQTVNLTSSAAGVTSYMWTVSNSGGTFDDATSQTPVFTAANVGSTTSATAKVIASNASGNCKDSAMVNLTINPPVSVTIANGATADACIGGTVSLDGVPAGGSGTYSTHAWTKVGGTGTHSISEILGGNQNTEDPTFTPGGSDVDGSTYQLQYTATDDAGCNAGTPAAITITVNSLPTLSTATLASATFCAGNQAQVNLTGLRASATFDITYSIGASTGLIASAVNSDGSGNASFMTISLTNADHNAQMVTVTSVLNTGTGCSSTVSVSTGSLTVNAQPSITGRDTTICSGQPVDLSTLLNETALNTLQTGSSYGVYTIGSMYNPTTTTTYFVRDSNMTTMCVDTAMITVTVNPQPSIVGRDTTVCSGSTVDLSTLLTGTALNTLESGTSFGVYAAGSIYNPTTTTTYFVRDSNTTTMCVDTAMVTVTVNAQPSITGRDTSICLGENVDLSTLIDGTPMNTLGYGTVFGTYIGTSSYSPTMTTTYFVRDSNTTTMCVDTAMIMVTVNAQPTITGRDTTICNGETVDLSTLLTGTAQNTLEYGTAYGTYGGTNSVSPASTTTYFVRDSNTTTMCVDTAMIMVTVNPQPAITGRDTTICNGETVDLSTLLTGTPLNTLEYGTAYGTYGGTNSVSPASTTTYFVRDSNTTTMCVDTAMIMVTVIAQPAITGRDTTICSGQPVDLSTLLNGTAQNPLGYGITYGDYPSGSTFNPTTTTTYFVRDSSSITMCVDTAMITVTVNAQPAITGRDTTICNGETVDLSTLIDGTPLNTLGFGSVYGSYAAGSIFSPSTTTIYFVLDSNFTTMCVDTAMIPVTVMGQPAIMGRDTTICNGETVDLSTLLTGTPLNTLEYGTAYGTYGGTNSVSPVSTTTYFVRDSNITAMCVDTAMITVVVNAKPLVSSSNITVAFGETINLSVSSTPTGVSFAWSHSNGFTSSLQNPSISNASANDAGVYTVVVTNANSCSSTATSEVTVTNVPCDANAGPDIVSDCGTTNLQAELPFGAAGEWILVSGDGNHTIENINDPNTKFSGTVGVTYLCFWRIDGGPCNLADIDFTQVIFENATLTIPGSPNAVYESGSAITSAVTIPSGNVAGFRSAVEVNLNPGFTVVAGATFTASIGTCPTPIPLLKPEISKLKIDARPLIDEVIIPEPGLQIRPNPFTVQSKVDVFLHEQDEVSILVMDQTGRRVKQLLNKQLLGPGNYTFELRDEQFTSGLLYIQLITSKTQIVKKALLIKDGGSRNFGY